MDIDLKGMLQHSFVITINDEQLAVFNQRFIKAGLDSPLPRPFRGAQFKNGVYRQSGFIKTKHIINCTISHYMIVSLAKALDWPYVCIFEEDALPSFDAKDLLQKTLSVVPSSCLCLRLGYRIVEDSLVGYSSNFISNAKAWGAHAQIVFKIYYDDMLKKFEEHPIADGTALNIDKDILLSRKCIFAQKNTFPDRSMHNGKPTTRYVEMYSTEERFDFQNG